MLPNLRLREDMVVTGACDLRGVLQGVAGVREKSKHLKDTHFTTFIMPDFNKQKVDGGKNKAEEGIITLGVSNLAGLLHHMVIGGETGT